jgi:tRNA wybutosine-synthesizing protein 1
VTIVYATQTGTSKVYADKLAAAANSLNIENIKVQDMAELDPDEITALRGEQAVLVLIVSTWQDGGAPPNAEPLARWLREEARDFRVSRTHLAGVKCAVLGLGNSIYGSTLFGKAARDLDHALRALSATAVLPVAVLDQDSGTDIAVQYQMWQDKLIRALSEGTVHGAAQTTSTAREKNKMRVEDEDELVESSSEEEADAEPMMDLEDLGGALHQASKKTRDEDIVITSREELKLLQKEMVTPSLAKSLTKQGYKLIGSHSGVKLCRWTKAMLRGRGGCYKHSFYGITSYQCMEMTPSLACANKCIFCWRHHKNPVGKGWRWKVDAPELLYEQAIALHRNMIRECRGVPGVSAERLLEADMPRHCALSLVGEPIIYPYINEFIDLLHKNRISSFMVTNAQFPDKIDELKPVTQLYISVDAATKESLKAVDRPLFDDFWERFLSSIDSLAKKGQRTVFRLTLIKEWNMTEVHNYASLLVRGKPDFVEIKGVTYCGTSKASPLKISNTPFHEEVVKFTQQICDEANKMIGEDNFYELACEHEHSTCMLMANAKKFKVNGEWHTWIDYDKFHELVNNNAPFSSEDYRAPTPAWAVFGSKEHGFDPEETRFQRKKKPPTQGC